MLKKYRQFFLFETRIDKNKTLVDNDMNKIKSSIRDCERDLLSTRTIHRIEIKKKKQKWRPFSYHLMLHLKFCDIPLRIEFCELFLMQTQEN